MCTRSTLDWSQSNNISCSLMLFACVVVADVMKTADMGYFVLFIFTGVLHQCIAKFVNWYSI